ncbi:hypothetical protein L2E82_41201 [Cichorium intybus]|uniref:Uncharacterized protein n=1 Tax=Cichorium intybus TaxID=13427 RepID=A0ACB9ANN3_CICIN|nr:hypothetical protein L2E82_41201 [Cichorium intybus]
MTVFFFSFNRPPSPSFLFINFYSPILDPATILICRSLQLCFPPTPFSQIHMKLTFSSSPLDRPPRPRFFLIFSQSRPAAVVVFYGRYSPSLPRRFLKSI